MTDAGIDWASTFRFLSAMAFVGVAILFLFPGGEAGVLLVFVVGSIMVIAMQLLQDRLDSRLLG